MNQNPSNRTNLPANKENGNKSQLRASSEENIEACVVNESVSTMDTDNVSGEITKKQPQTDSPLPSLDTQHMLTEVKSDTRNSYHVNSSPLQGCKVNAKNSQPSSQSSKASSTLLKFFQPVTPDAKNPMVGHPKTSSKNDGEVTTRVFHSVSPSAVGVTASKTDKEAPSKYVNSPCTPPGLMMVANGETTTSGAISSTDRKVRTYFYHVGNKL